MIAFDRSPRSVVAVCSCGARDVFTSQSVADGWAVAHVLTAHADAGDQADRTRALTAASSRRHTLNRGNARTT